MAEYTNLTTLEGLQVGDVVTYDTTDVSINLAGYKVKFEVIGNKSTQQNGSSFAGYKTVYRYGGYSCGTTLDRTNKTVYFSNTKSATFSSKPTTETDWLYSRFIVAGNCGDHSFDSCSGNAKKAAGGNGGGLTAANGEGTYIGKGGTQTAAGRGYSSTYKSNNGAFGTGGVRTEKEVNYGTVTIFNGAGGDGWYGGGSGGGLTANINNYSNVGGAGGGSGYVLTSDSEKPSGYMEDWADYELTDATLTTGGAEAYITYNVGIITILEAAGPSQSTLNYYNGTEFKKCYATYYNGTSFIDCDAYYYDGTEFKKIGGE